MMLLEFRPAQRLSAMLDRMDDTTRLRLACFVLALSVSGIDMVWASLAQFQVDYGNYLKLLLLSLALFAGSMFYRSKRPDPRLSAMLFGAGFLCLFSAAASMLNYCLLTVAGPRIDDILAAIDHSLGFQWPASMVFIAQHPVINSVLYASYFSMLPQMALLLCVLGRRESHLRIYRFCIAMAVGALICIATWSIAPSFGAISVYPMPVEAAHMRLALDQNYAQMLISLLADGPGFISPVDVKGLIGFPSYHAVLALLTVYYAWSTTLLRWPAVFLNAAVLVATPFQGGHHLIDVLAGVPVAAIALLVAGEPWILRLKKGGIDSSLVAPHDLAANCAKPGSPGMSAAR